MKKRLFSFSVLLVVIILSVSLMPIQNVSAANGSLVGTVTFAQNCASGLGVGIAFDGTNLWVSCYASNIDLYKANPTSGAILASFHLKGGLGALAWDSRHGKLWAGAGCGPGQSGSEVYLFDPGTGVASLQFNVPNFNGNCLDDGLAYDATNDTIYHSWDGALNIRHLSTTGVPQSDDNFSWGGNDCYSSGLAIGGDLLYEGSDGCNHVWVVNKTTKTASFDFSTAIAGDPNFRDEGLTCDTNTFASQGKHVMWSKEAYSPNRASAFEIPFNTCGVGGQPAGLDDYKQNVGEWASKHLYNNNSCGTMAGYGCAVTSLTDILAAYKRLNGERNFTPLDMNNLLAAKSDTHSGCGLVWTAVAKAVNYEIQDYRWKHVNDYGPLIDAALQNNHLVVAKIIGEPDRNGFRNTHFVVFYKKAAQNAPDGSPDYYILDPYMYGQPLGNVSQKTLWEAHHETIKQIDAFYKSQADPSSFQIEIVKNKAPQPGRAWAIIAHSPVQMLITDPLGVQTGYIASTGTILQNIPESSYGLETGIFDDTGENPPLPSFLYFGQNQLESGVYKVQVIGTGSGPYSLDFITASGPDDISSRTFASQTVAGQIDTYFVNVLDDQPLAISLQVNIDIKPGETPNPINLKSTGLIPVAVLSTAFFDAATVDQLSVRFGPQQASAVNYGFEDVNGDGFRDLVLQFNTQQTGLKVGDTQACLSGSTQSGLGIQGCDQVRVRK
jgi:hypothetical protein